MEDKRIDIAKKTAIIKLIFRAYSKIRDRKEESIQNNIIQNNVR